VNRLTGDEEVAADLTQETFVKAWRALPRLRESQAFGGWLRIIATNLVRDHSRRRKPERAMTDESAEEGVELDPADGAPSAADHLAQQASYRAIREAVGRLPEPQRLVIVMYHFEDKPVAEIAADLGIPLGTVLSRLARGREALRRRLKPYVEV